MGDDLSSGPVFGIQVWSETTGSWVNLRGELDRASAPHLQQVLDQRGSSLAIWPTGGATDDTRPEQRDRLTLLVRGTTSTLSLSICGNGHRREPCSADRKSVV